MSNKTYNVTDQVFKDVFAGDNKDMELKEISQQEAAQLLQDNSTVIYIREGALPVNTSHNTFMLSGKAKDGSFNMYMAGATPAEIGLDAIVEWLKERTLQRITFFTYYSNEFILI
jgi:hypothetical protein